MSTKKLVAILILCFAAMVVMMRIYSASVTLAWDPNSETDLAGYRIWRSTNWNQPMKDWLMQDVGNVTNVTQAGLEYNITYWWYATAYNTSNLESDASNVIQFTPSTNPVPSTPTLNYR